VVAENTLEWELVDVKQRNTTTTTTNKDGMHRVNPNFETDAKMTSIMRRFETLQMSKVTQSSALNHQSQWCLLFVSFVTIMTTWLNNALGYQISKWSKKMYSIHFASQTPTKTHSVKRTIRVIQTFHENLFKDKDIEDHFSAKSKHKNK